MNSNDTKKIDSRIAFITAELRVLRDVFRQHSMAGCADNIIDAIDAVQAAQSNSRQGSGHERFSQQVPE